MPAKRDTALQHCIMLNVGHVPEDHGQVGKAEIQQLQKTEPLINGNSGAASDLV